MAEALLHHLRVRVLLEQNGGMGMASCMKMDAAGEPRYSRDALLAVDGVMVDTRPAYPVRVATKYGGMRWELREGRFVGRVEVHRRLQK